MLALFFAKSFSPLLYLIDEQNITILSCTVCFIHCHCSKICWVWTCRQKYFLAMQQQNSVTLANSRVSVLILCVVELEHFKLFTFITVLYMQFDIASEV